VGTLVAYITASHLGPGLPSLVATLTGAEFRVAVHTDHHRAGDFPGYGVKAMTDASMAVAAVQDTLLTVHDLALDQFVRYQEFVLHDLLRQVKMTDDALFRLLPGDVEDESCMPGLLVIGFP